jgi:hypothetical protein
MRITPPSAAAPRRNASRRVALTVDSELGATILRMIATHSLSAFTPAVGPANGVQPGDVKPVRGITPAAATQGQDAGGAQRTLGAVPPHPARPLPRGSLLDLRV